MTEIVFWQNNLSGHQAPLLKALANLDGVRVVLVSTHGASSERRDLGWDDADYGATRVVVTADPSQRERLVAELRTASAHVFSGIGAYPQVDLARKRLRIIAPGARKAVITESWDARGFRGFMRLARARLNVAGALRDVDLVFTIGRQARRQFNALTTDSRKIVPFAYTVETPPIDPLVRREVGVAARLTFVGALSEWKDPGILLSALGSLERLEWTLTLVGDGPLRGTLEEQSRRLSMDERVTFKGHLPPKDVARILGASDLLVLPSRYDGWGAVVNEALMVGTPVVVSRAAGAAELIASDLQGGVFATGDAQGLQALLAEQIRNPPTSSRRADLIEWSRRTISADVVAALMLRHLTGNGDTSEKTPWLSQGNEV